MSALKAALRTVAGGDALSPDAMRGAMTAILDGAAEDIEVAGFLMGLRARGETAAEIAAAATVMRERATRVEAPPDVVDTCGTGGDGADTFNISTAAALIAAGAGARVAKHGNRAVSSRSGSSDVLAALGVRIDAAPAAVARCIREAGVGFMFAPAHHAATARVAGVRRALGVRTLFNIIGPLTNPAGARRQVVGVFDRALLEPVAEALVLLGAERAYVVHGSDGLDELTTTGPSAVVAVENGAVRAFTASPADAGLRRASRADLVGGDPAANAAALTAVLEGAHGPYRDIACLNAAAALVVAGLAASLAEGVAAAASAIDDGRAMAALDRLRIISNEAPANAP